MGLLLHLSGHCLLLLSLCHHLLSSQMLRVCHPLRRLRTTHHLVEIHKVLQFRNVTHQLLDVYVGHGELLLLLLRLVLAPVAPLVSVIHSSFLRENKSDDQMY